MFEEHCGDDTTFTEELELIFVKWRRSDFYLYLFFSSNGVDRNLNTLLSFMILSQGILMLH